MELDTNTNADQPAAEPVGGEADVPGLFGNMFVPGTGLDERPATEQELDKFPGLTAEKPAEPEVPNKEKPDRYEYWQREADLRKREKELIAQELEQRKQWDPVLQFISQDPEAYKYIEGRIQGQRVQEQGPQPPKPPERPASYNEQEAYTAPDSPSWKYRAELERFRDAKIEYLEQVNAMREQKVTQTLQQREIAEKRNQQMLEVRAELIRVHGYSPEDADGFMQRMTHPSSLTLENLVKLDRLLASQGQPKRAATGGPTPPFGAGAPPAKPITDVGQAFNMSMAGWDEVRLQRLKNLRSK